jgi:hypothetical protein
MQSYCLESSENMKDTDQKWVRIEIQTAIQQHLDPRGWRKLLTYLPVVGILAIFLTLLGLAGAGWYYGLTKMGQEAAFQAHTADALKLITDRLSRIEEKLGILQAQNAITKYSIIPVKELKKHRDELVDVRKSLASLPQDTPNYWPASFQIIALLSQAQFQLETIGQQPLSTMSNVRMFNTAPLSFVVREKNVLLKDLIQGVHFENSVIHFDPSVKLVDDTFINCVFILPPQENPPKSFQEIGRTLLTSDLSKVILNAS